MGTSKNYEAPPAWGPIKSAVTTTAKQGFLTPSKASKVVSSFVEGMRTASRGGLRGSPGQRGSGGRGGGGRGGGRHGSISRGGGTLSVARALGSFLSDVTQRGLSQALAASGITSLAGMSVDEVALALTDALGGPASTVDDVDLRNALSALIDKICEGAETIEAMEAAFADAALDMGKIIERLFGHYIYERFCTTMYANLADQQGFAVADSYLTEIKNYIDGKLAVEGTTRDLSSVDWAGNEGAAIVAEILEATWTIFSEPQ